MDFMNFVKLLEKTKLPEKFELPSKRGFETTEMRKKKNSSCLANPTL